MDIQQEDFQKESYQYNLQKNFNWENIESPQQSEQQKIFMQKMPEKTKPIKKSHEKKKKCVQKQSDIKKKKKESNLSNKVEQEQEKNKRKDKVIIKSINRLIIRASKDYPEIKKKLQFIKQQNDKKQIIHGLKTTMICLRQLSQLQLKIICQFFQPEILNNKLKLKQQIQKPDDQIDKQELKKLRKTISKMEFIAGLKFQQLTDEKLQNTFKELENAGNDRSTAAKNKADDYLQWQNKLKSNRKIQIQEKE